MKLGQTWSTLEMVLSVLLVLMSAVAVAAIVMAWIGLNPDDTVPETTTAALSTSTIEQGSTTAVPSSSSTAVPDVKHVSCSFENGFCDWKPDPDAPWRVLNGSNYPSSTGPEVDHTFMNSTGSYITCWRGPTECIIRSQNLSSDRACLEFWYYMYGRDVYKLSVLVGTGTEDERILWSKQGNLGKSWLPGQIYLNETDTFWFVFKAERTRRGTENEISLDDISLTMGPCPIRPSPEPKLLTTAAPLPKDCGGPRIFTEANSSFTSLGYPSRYPEEADCLWYVKAAPGLNVLLNITDLDLALGRDLLDVLDGEEYNTTRLATLTGNGPFQTLASQTNLVTLHLTSGKLTSGKGFAANYITGYRLGLPPPCAEKEFRCQESKDCISMDTVCDGKNDCNDASDEVDCMMLWRGKDVGQGVARGFLPPTWHSICADDSLMNLDQLICSTLHYPHSQGSTHLNASGYGPYAIANVSDSGNLILKHSTKCLSDNVLYVQCTLRDCGRHLLPSTGLQIAGGSDAPAGSWPWIASLQYKNNHICGANLIAPGWLLTAAHCVLGREKLLENWVAYLGLIDLFNTDASDVVMATAVAIYSHPHYDSRCMDSDVALIQLAQPLNMTKYIQPICLAEEDQSFKPGFMCHIAGWGSSHPKAQHACLCFSSTCVSLLQLNMRAFASAQHVCLCFSSTCVPLLQLNMRAFASAQHACLCFSSTCVPLLQLNMRAFASAQHACLCFSSTCVPLLQLNMRAFASAQHACLCFSSTCVPLLQLNMRAFASAQHACLCFSSTCVSLLQLNMRAFASAQHACLCFSSTCVPLLQLNMCAFASAQHVCLCFSSTCVPLLQLNMRAFASAQHVCLCFSSTCVPLLQLNMRAFASAQHVCLCFSSTCVSLLQLNMRAFASAQHVCLCFSSTCVPLLQLNMRAFASAQHACLCFSSTCVPLLQLNMRAFASAQHACLCFSSTCVSLLQLNMRVFASAQHACLCFSSTFVPLLQLNMRAFASAQHACLCFSSTCMLLLQLNMRVFASAQHACLCFSSTCVPLLQLNMRVFASAQHACLCFSSTCVPLLQLNMRVFASAQHACLCFSSTCVPLLQLNMRVFASAQHACLCFSSTCVPLLQLNMCAFASAQHVCLSFSSTCVRLLQLNMRAFASAQHACLCFSSTCVSLLPFLACFLFPGPTFSKLQEAPVPLVSTETCMNQMADSFNITSHMICAGYPQGGIDTCSGDSGGPLICEDVGHEWLVGVTSFGIGCAQTNRSGIYAQVASLLPWIKQQIEKAERTKPVP
uniref:uncharacterized protein n=1 Tax=Myxine glutinosa TaxID=7769 RepID=UPI00358F9E8C